MPQNPEARSMPFFDKAKVFAVSTIALSGVAITDHQKTHLIHKHHTVYEASGVNFPPGPITECQNEQRNLGNRCLAIVLKEEALLKDVKERETKHTAVHAAAVAVGKIEDRVEAAIVPKVWFANKPTTTTAIPPTTVTTQPSNYGVTQADIVAWSKVNICEEGGDWNVRGSQYSGGLGISNVNWVAYGGQEFADNAADATQVQQIAVAKRIQPYPPDQNGCTGSW